MKDLIIIGAGGVGRETAWIIEQINEEKETYNILGFIDADKEIWGKDINGYRCLGDLEYILNSKYRGEVVVSIANYKVKKFIVNQLKKNNIKYATIIHPKVKIPKTTRIGIGTIVYEGAIISPNVIIGNHVIISPKVGIGHDSIIKDYASLLWNVNISGNDLIEEGVMFGSGSTIIQNRKVGCHSIIGAGAVVIKDIDRDCTVIGIPAQKIY
ncbi:acetyltransferase [Clostridium mediterraneense]|uniref:acetyltransferase n=1 Tax=Clostridium mediterraneense TaxID=1805472 RepID=UPI00082DF450|nr:acetyltransferase [Clostridium mediterraneense]